MNKLTRLRNRLPSPLNAVLATVSAILLVLAFPDFEFSFFAWFALIPLFFAIEREKESVVKSFLTGWLFGLIFFFGTCWWLTFAPITYAGMPWLLVYFFMFCAALVVGILPGIFGTLFSIAIKKFGSYAILSAPFLWTFTEFLRMWLTGNNWNAIGYSQAFNYSTIHLASIGGVYLVGVVIVFFNGLLTVMLRNILKERTNSYVVLVWILISTLVSVSYLNYKPQLKTEENKNSSLVVAVQPNVPMNGLTYEKYQQLLERHIQLAEDALRRARQLRTTNNEQPITIIFPESPMIFQYGRDENLQKFLRDFAVKNNASVLFNSAEMTRDGKRAMNSAVMIDEKGEKIAQYDKIHLLPFGEYIPFPEPIASRMPAFVGNFEFGDEYDLLPFGDAKGGVMICFESHFGELSREYARRGTDVLIEMTNDGYLGNTPVLRQHLANSVFRAVETNRPVLRVTNVGVTAYINERGKISDAAEVYTEATRVWTVEKSDGKQTIYVKYGDWFAWLCSLVSLALLFGSYFYKKPQINIDSQS